MMITPAAITMRKNPDHRLATVMLPRPELPRSHLGLSGGGVLASVAMTSNTALRDTVPLPDALAGRSIVLVGLMGAGKTSIGRRLSARLGLPFRDADAEIELAAGCTIPELFSALRREAISVLASAV